MWMGLNILGGLWVCTQVRAASDPAHIDFIQRCRSEEKPMQQSDLDRLRVLTASDIQMDRDWLFATVAVTGNRQRQAINDVRAQHFARLRGQPVIRWKRDIATTLLDSQHAEVLRAEFPDLIGTFVAGAPGIILNNDLNPSRGLANGTPAKFHSLILRDASKSTDAGKINNAGPGEEVWIEPPYAVNVLIEHLDSSKWCDQATLAPELRESTSDETATSALPRTIVLPVKISKRLDDLSVNRASRKSKIYYRSHGVDLAFALTFHKFQGQTVGKILLDLSQTPKNVFRLCFQAFYVGMTRVKKSDCIRILPGPDGGKPDLSHLLSFEPDPELQRWLDAFDMQTREWTRPPPKEPPRTSAEKARPSSRGKRGGAKGNGGDVANQGLVGTINEGACKGRGSAVTKGRKGRGGRGQGKGGARATKGSGRGQSK